MLIWSTVVPLRDTLITNVRHGGIFMYQGDALIRRITGSARCRPAYSSGAWSAGDECGWRTIDFQPMEVYIRIQSRA